MEKKDEFYVYAYVNKFQADGKKQTVILEIDYDYWNKTSPLVNVAGSADGVGVKFTIFDKEEM